MQQSRDQFRGFVVKNTLYYNAKSKCRILLVIFVGLFVIHGVSVGQNPASRPLLFVHGFCGNASDWKPLLSPLYQQLPTNLYPSAAMYYVLYDSIRHSTTFLIDINGILWPVSESSIPSTTRFFSIEFYDPNGKGSGIDVDVVKISVLNKAYEISQVIKHITAITHIKDVIVVSHSMGGLDTRAYIENMASPGECYDYSQNKPDYNASTCNPGSGKAAYADDVGDLITVDTPHAGTPFAGANADKLLLLLLEQVLGKCLADDSTNKRELALQQDGGSGLLEGLNYSGSAVAGVIPTKTQTPIQAVEDYFNDVATSWDGLSGYSDDAVLQPSQSIILNLPKSYTTASRQDVPIPFSSSDQGVNGTPACWKDALGLHFAVLHFMTCLGEQQRTQDAIASQINAHAIGTLTKITVQAMYNGNTWPSAVSYQLTGPGGTQNKTTPPLSVSDVPVGTYSVNYISGGPPGVGPPTISASPSDTIQSGQWAITFTIDFSSNNSVVTTSPASSVTASGAVLNGTVGPQGASGHVGFYYGTDPTLSTFNQTCGWFACPQVISDFTTQTFPSQLFGLASNTVYYFRIVFYDTNNGSYKYGNIQSFKTALPVAKTLVATSVTASAALILGTVNPQGDGQFAGFYYGTDPALRTFNQTCGWFACPQVTPNFTTQGFNSQLSGLASNTVYFFRMVFYDTFNGTYHYGRIRSFRTRISVATTLAATSITASGALINGMVNPQGDGQFAGFYYGTDPILSVFNQTCGWFACPQVTPNFTTQGFNSRLSGLASNTVYYFRMVFYDTNNGTYRYGKIQSFRTRISVATTLVATSISASGALINGTVNPQGDGQFAGFYYGTDPTLRTFNQTCGWFACPQVVPDFTTQRFNSRLFGLASNTVYFFRMVFYDTFNGTYHYGRIQSFRTRISVATTLPATSITASSALVNGTVNPQGASGRAGYYWGTDPTLSTFNLSCGWFVCPQVAPDFTTQMFPSQLSGLAANTTYYFRAVFWNTDNNSFQSGGIQSFRTLP